MEGGGESDQGKGNGSATKSGGTEANGLTVGLSGCGCSDFEYRLSANAETSFEMEYKLQAATDPWLRR
jgi:hypothetical protein